MILLKKSQLTTSEPLFPSLFTKSLQAGSEDLGRTGSACPAMCLRPYKGTTAHCLSTQLSPRVTWSESGGLGASVSIQL